jgi:hypothetical protein
VKENPNREKIIITRLGAEGAGWWWYVHSAPRAGIRDETGIRELARMIGFWGSRAEMRVCLASAAKFDSRASSWLAVSHRQ